MEWLSSFPATYHVSGYFWNSDTLSFEVLPFKFSFCFWQWIICLNLKNVVHKHSWAETRFEFNIVLVQADINNNHEYTYNDNNNDINNNHKYTWPFEALGRFYESCPKMLEWGLGWKIILIKQILFNIRKIILIMETNTQYQHLQHLTANHLG